MISNNVPVEWLEDDGLVYSLLRFQEQGVQTIELRRTRIDLQTLVVAPAAAECVRTLGQSVFRSTQPAGPSTSQRIVF